MKTIKRIWVCLTNFNDWRTRRKIDKAIVVMINNGISTDLAHQLWEVSDKLWEDAYKKYDCN